METLIVILIVVMIAQTVLFIYNDILEKTSQKQVLTFQEQVKNAQIDFTAEKEQMRKNYEAKDEIIRQWINKCNKLDVELSEARKVNGLLKSRTACVEGLQDSFNQQAEDVWRNRGYIEPKGNQERLRFVEGMKAGAEWVAECVGIKVEFEIDDRHKEV